MKRAFSKPIRIFLGLLVALALPLIAVASSVDESIVDTTAPTGTVTLAPGASGSITINLTVTGNQEGTAKFKVYRDWTLSGGSFAGANEQQFTVNARAAQDPATTFSTSGTVTVASGQASGTFTLAVGAFDITNSNQQGGKLAAGQSSSYVVTVEASNTPPSNTSPRVSISEVTNGATYEIGSVPAATCQVTDTEDGNSSFAATLSAVTGQLSAYRLGAQTASCSYTDRGGLTGSAAVTYTIVDTTAPVITFVSRTAANGNGWNNSDVMVTWSCSDSGSDVVAASVSQTVSSEGANQSATGTCEDNAGNKTSDTKSGINIDKTAPNASASASPAANGNGWNNTNVTVSFSGTDGLSGIAGCTNAVELTTEGAGQSGSGTCTDKAGNVSAAATVSNINIDKTAPAVSLVGGPSDGGSYYFGFVPAAPTCNASDALSGLDGSCLPSGYSNAVGSHTVTASATDKAGNSKSASMTYTVLAWTLKGFYQPVDMNGVFNTVKAGATVPLKFEVFAGATELTDTASVKSLTSAQTQCDANAITDDVETTATGGTSLRYDITAGQFVYNWQTSGKAGQCYRVTLTTLDLSPLVAFFKLK